MDVSKISPANIFNNFCHGNGICHRTIFLGLFQGQGSANFGFYERNKDYIFLTKENMPKHHIGGIIFDYELSSRVER